MEPIESKPFDIKASAPTLNQQQVSHDDVEGELKRIKSFWSSQKDIYKLKFPNLQVKRVLKSGAHEYKNKYDLKLYAIRLSRKEKNTFYLEPKEDYFRLPRLEFETKRPEDRAQWYLAITKAYKDDELLGQQFIS